MADDITEALGHVVQALRTSLGMTQEELGARAGYGTGAAVSISRFENGKVRPGPEKLRRIAAALRTTREELERRAAEDAALAVGGNRERPKDRVRRVDGEVSERKQALAAVNSKFRLAQERVKADFLTKLVDSGSRIEGAQPLNLPRLSGNAESGVEAAGGDHVKEADGFLGPVADGATLGLILSLLRGATGRPVAGIALPVIAAVALAAVSGMTTVRLQQERARQTDRAEAQLAATESSFSALMILLPRAAEILEYIAVHAGHALGRWDHQLGTPSPSWDELTDDAKRRFREFLEISKAAFDVCAIDFEALAEIQDSEALIGETARIDRLLTSSHDLATSRV